MKKQKINHTYDSCKEIASNCLTKTEYFNKDKKSYNYAYNHGWLDDICSHMIVIKKEENKFDRCIYSFEFPDNHVYVGLTKNLTKRRKR